ncbi:MAG: hypothetical protein PHU31_07555 [Anaerotignum sp.]|nr:hypothetical protein [Anaerotignum sp.]
MITIFNRKELMITYSMEKQAKIRNLLVEHNIDYSISTLGNMMQSYERSMNPLTPRINPPTEYRIYVKKQDYEKAIHLLNENR